MIGFKNSYAYIEGEKIKKTSLGVENGKFVLNTCQDDFEELNDDLMIIPGFIDEHFHGAGGHDFMDGRVKSIDAVAKIILQDGVTSFLATTMTMSIDHIIQSLNACRDYKGQYATMLGVHLEGPFISKKHCGAQDPQFIIEPTGEALEKLAQESGDKIRIVTYAPEEAQDSFYEVAKKHHIILSAGHCDATSSQMEQAFNKGMTQTTHTFNAMRGIHHRDIGCAGYSMLNNEMKSELICDFHHVDINAVRLLAKNKKKHHLLLITDSMEARFLEDGEYALGGQKVFVKDGTARLINGTLAGSILHMNDAVKNIKKALDCSLEDAIDMATIAIAKNLHIDDKKGSIAEGKDADFIIVDRNLNVVRTYVKGKKVYDIKDSLLRE